MLKQKILKAFAIIALLTLPLPLLAQSPDPGFNPGKLIDDKVFADTQTFGGPEGIQKFLLAKNSVLANTAPDFLIKLKEPATSLLKSGLEDPQPNLSRLRTAAELIWDASRQSGLNPQVILVTLNKEQSLITGQFNTDASLQKALDHALGFACLDSGGCGDLFPGFYYQLFGNFDSAGNRYLGATKSLMKSFSVAGGRGPVVGGAVSHVGDTITLDNTMGGYDNIVPQQSVQLTNNATAALYRYTPHIFNGNYNFWRFFQAWFKYPNGTLLKLANGVDTYIIQNGLKQLVPQFVAQARNLNLSGTLIASPTEFDSYQTDKVLGPTDNTIVQIIGEGKKFVFIDNVKHPASDFVIKQRGLDPAKTLAVAATDSALFQDGSILTPKDGTILRGQVDQTVYLVANGSLQTFSSFTFKQRKITAKQVTTIPDAEVSTYPKLGYVPPMDGTAFKAANDTTVYLAQSGLAHPITAEIFKNRGIKAKDIAVLSNEEVGSMPFDSYASPKEKSFFSVAETGQLYIFKDSAKHPISAFVAKQRGITPDFTVNLNVAFAWQDSIPVAPRDGTIVKGDNDTTVYLVQTAQLRPLTALAFKNRKITPKKITVLPQAEVEAYAKGEAVVK